MPLDVSRLVQLFPTELRTASVVPRWSVVWTLTRDTVANHSYYVTMYALAVADVIDWAGSRASLAYLALTHDLDETITGDIVSPIKAEIVDHERAECFIDAKMQERMPGIYDRIVSMTDAGEPAAPSFNKAKWRAVEETFRIIKVADRLDALLFLLGEQRMGNGVIAPRLPDAEARLRAAWLQLPARDEILDATWQLIMLPVIRAHRTEGGHGV